jgi:hypothetical protein
MKDQWPLLSYQSGRATYETLQLWTQIVGKIKLVCVPWVNHSWNITLHITPSGLTTQTITYQNQHFQIDFDFRVHQLIITTSQGEYKQFSLEGISVAGFYKQIFGLLKELDIELTINPLPSEIMGELIPFEEDQVHHTYDPLQANSFHQALLCIQDVFMVFRTEFSGKASPVHFFWGGFDLALAFFSGRKAPRHPGKVPNMPDWVLQDAYSREVSDTGFWTGSDSLPQAAFYCYLYPEPLGYKTAQVQPSEAYYSHELSEFILPYQAVQMAADPKEKLLQFLRSTYQAGAALANWDPQLWDYQARTQELSQQ